MNVWLSVHGRFHAFSLASELRARGALAGLATTYPAFMVRKHLQGADVLRTAPWLEAVRRVAARLPLNRAHTDLWIAEAFGRFAAAQLPVEADIFVGWSGASLEAIPGAQARGMRVIIERGSSHITSQTAVLADEYARFGIRHAPTHPQLIERELAEYAAADAIAVPSIFASQTFERCGIPRRKLIVNPYGVDLQRFTPRTRARRPGPVRVLFVGGIGLRKGVPWLLEASGRLGRSVELHLVGPFDPVSRHIINSRLHTAVVVHGPLRAPALEAVYADADLFCLPSIEEGFPLALLQAMAAGLPVVATPATGASGFLTDGQDGLVVPERNPDALAEALATLAGDEPRRRAMGNAARQRVGRGFSWSDYGSRSVAAYSHLLASGEGLNFLAFGGAAG